MKLFPSLHRLYKQKKMFDEIIKKMTDQIEMSTAEGLAPANVFHQTFNFFGRPVPS